MCRSRPEQGVVPPEIGNPHKKLWKCLFTGTVPVNKNYRTGTVPVNKNYPTGTVPVNKNYPTSTVPVNKNYPAGTVSVNKNHPTGTLINKLVIFLFLKVL